MQPALFRDGIAAEPAPERGVIVTSAVIEQAGFGIRIFGGEAEIVLVGVGAGGADRLAEGVVFIGGEEGAAGAVDEGGDVAVAVVGGQQHGGAGFGVQLDREQAADAAAVLQGFREVQAPRVGGV